MEIKKAEFTLSAPMVSMCPADNKPEYAFIGRSNVGKSSLINMLTNNKKLAKTSATPGKTLLINHFIINNDWYLVDLPGYGYAKRSKKEIEKLDQMIRGYILQREQLVNVFVLVDIRLKAQKIDLEFIEWLGLSSVPFAIVFTKADKLSAAKVSASVEAYKKVLLETWEELPPIFITSAEKRQGRDLVVRGAEPEKQTATQEEAIARVRSLVAEDMRLKDACRQAGEETGFAKNELYRLALAAEEGESGDA